MLNTKENKEATAQVNSKYPHTRNTDQPKNQGYMIGDMRLFSRPRIGHSPGGMAFAGVVALNLSKNGLNRIVVQTDWWRSLTNDFAGVHSP